MLHCLLGTGVPNTLNVLTSFPLLLVGVPALVLCLSRCCFGIRFDFYCYCVRSLIFQFWYNFFLFEACEEKFGAGCCSTPERPQRRLGRLIIIWSLTTIAWSGTNCRYFSFSVSVFPSSLFCCVGKRYFWPKVGGFRRRSLIMKSHLSWTWWKVDDFMLTHCMFQSALLTLALI